MSNKELVLYEFGDIVIARRPKSNIEGHMYGPYIVVKIINNDAYLLYGTSKEQKDLRNFFCLDSSKYNLKDKAGYFNYNIVKIDKSNIINKRSDLDIADKEYLKKKLSIRNSLLNGENKFPFLEKCLVDVGHIIEFNDNTYVVIDFQGDYLNCLKVRYSYGKRAINSNGKYYCIDYNRIVKIHRDSKYLQKDVLTVEATKNILETLNSFLKNKENYKIDIKIGDIISDNKSLYFVYEIENNKVCVFKIHKYNYDRNLNYIVNINNKTYWTNFELYQFNKNTDNIHYYDSAKQTEIREIRRQRKVKKKEKTSNNKKKKKNDNADNVNFDIGTIVLTKNFRTLINKKYIILFKHNNTVYLADYDEYQKGNIKTTFLNVNDLIYYGNIDSKNMLEILKVIKYDIIMTYDKKVYESLYDEINKKIY